MPFFYLSFFSYLVYGSLGYVTICYSQLLPLQYLTVDNPSGDTFFPFFPLFWTITFCLSVINFVLSCCPKFQESNPSIHKPGNVLYNTKPLMP